MADGTKAQNLNAHGGKGSNIFIDPMTRKNPEIVGPYKPKVAAMHHPGMVFSGPKLISVLLDYGLEFKDGATSQIKNSPMAIQMYYKKDATGKVITKNGIPIPIGVVVKTKPSPPLK